jgi:hypothetical protein
MPTRLPLGKGRNAGHSHSTKAGELSGVALKSQMSQIGYLSPVWVTTANSVLVVTFARENISRVKAGVSLKTPAHDCYRFRSCFAFRM